MTAAEGVGHLGGAGCKLLLGLQHATTSVSHAGSCSCICSIISIIGQSGQSRRKLRKIKLDAYQLSNIISRSWTYETGGCKFSELSTGMKRWRVFNNKNLLMSISS